MDLVPAVAKLKIVLANQAVVPLGRVLNEPQLHLLYTIGKLHEAQRPIRIVILKARQLGLSTVVEAVLFLLCMSSPRLRSMIISHNKESAQHLLDMSKHYWDTYWAKSLYTTDSDNRNMLSWKETRSSLTVATARNASAGRSFTFQALHACVAEGERVWTTNGMMNVESIEGQMVRTHTGVFTRVGKVTRREDRPLVRVRTWRAQPLTVTPEHTFPTTRGKLEAQELVKGDYLIYPKRRIRHLLTSLPFKTTARREGKGEGNGRQRCTDDERIEFNEETGFAIGYFIAEGSVFWNKGNHPAGINFSRHRDEKPYADRACLALEGLFASRRTTDRKNSLATTETLYSAGLAEWLIERVGSYSWNKTIQPWMWMAGEEFCRGVLIGYLCGDGSKVVQENQGYTSYRVSARTVSEELAFDVRDLALSLNLGWGSVRANPPRERYGVPTRPSWDVDWTGTAARSIRNLMGLEVEGQGRPWIEKAVEEDDRVLLPIRDVVEAGRGVAFDVAVEHEDHTFVCSSFATGNSEVAFWDNAETLMTGLAQTLPDLPNTYCFLESTANGVGGYFYDTYQAAKAGDSDYVSVFYPWFTVSKYSFPWVDDIPGYRLDAEERLLRKIGVGDPHLAWRRWAIVNKCNGSLEQFHQEYPSSDTEAFITSGTNVFPVADLDACYHPSDSPDWPKRGQLLRDPPGSNNITFHEDTHAYIKTQPFRVYRKPHPQSSYMVSGDPTRTIHGDNAAIQVIDRRTMEVVAQWRGKTDPSSFADRLIEVAVYYNWAMIVTEINGPGTATIQRLLVLEYPHIWQNQAAERDPGTLGHNYGWASSQRRKNEMIGHLLRAIVEHDLIFHDEDTYNELKNYVALDHGQFGNSSDEAHDDLVTSLAIGLTALIYEAPALESSPRKVDPMNPRVQAMEMDGQELALPDYNAPPPPWEEWERENATLGDFDPLL